MRFIFPVIYFALFIELSLRDPEVWGFVGFSLIVYFCHLGTDRDEEAA